MHGLYWSADGVNYSLVKTNIQSVLPVGDAPVFIGMTETPFGYHMLLADRWDNRTNSTKRVTHLFSKDLKSWKILELNSEMKNKKYYKGAHLYYDAGTNKVWSFSSCGEAESCGYLGWFTAQEF